MMQIRETLGKLKAEEPVKYEVLMAAFNKCEACIIDLPNNSFIGVHLTNLDNFNVEEHVGYWYVGTIKVGA
jgi:hypothetical protein